MDPSTNNSFQLLQNDVDDPTFDTDKFNRYGVNKPYKNGKTQKQQYHHHSNNKNQIQNGHQGGFEDLKTIPGWQDMLEDKKQRVNFIANPLVWIDLEMTGLDLEKDTILEIACLITDGNLETVVEGPNLAINHSSQIIESMNQWCQEHHYASGLVQRVYQSEMTMEQAEESVLKFLKHFLGPKQAQLAGNSVHVDKTFLTKCMPQIVEYLHYRIVDVSTIKELCKRWYPDQLKKMPKKRSVHLAMDDILQSVKELKYYKNTIFK